jgi:hypothetical protein
MTHSLDWAGKIIYGSLWHFLVVPHRKPFRFTFLIMQQSFFSRDSRVQHSMKYLYLRQMLAQYESLIDLLLLFSRTQFFGSPTMNSSQATSKLGMLSGAIFKLALTAMMNWLRIFLMHPICGYFLSPFCSFVRSFQAFFT